MSDDYGPKMGNAMRAVRMMHADTSRLLRECDTRIGQGRRSVFGAYATKELTWSVNAECWMAEAVYRYWPTSDQRVVEGVTVCFFDREDRIEQPLLIAGRLRYVKKGACDGWDLWSAFFEWSPERRLDEVLTSGGDPKGRLLGATLLARPLYSVASVEDVVGSMDRVRQAAAAAG